jgi:hypothetical protein
MARLAPARRTHQGAGCAGARGTRFRASRAGRARLPLEVYSRVRSEVGEDFAVGCRLLSEECIEGGTPVQDTLYFGCQFARAGMDLLSLSRGGKFEDAKQPKVGEAAYPYTGRSGYECMPSYYSDAYGPYGRNLEPTARVRAAIRDQGWATPTSSPLPARRSRIRTGSARWPVAEAGDLRTMGSRETRRAGVETLGGWQTAPDCAALIAGRSGRDL